MKKLKLKHLLNEGFIGMSTGKSPVVGGLTRNKISAPQAEQYVTDSETEAELTEEARQQFLETVAKYNSFAKSIYREHALKDVVSEIKKIGQLTERVVFESTDDWYDKLTLKKEMKNLADDVKLFEKTAQETAQLQHRLESLYESIGTKLNKYFDIKEDQAQTEEDKW